MTDTEVREVLTRATDHLAPAPDLLDRVRAGGRRRVIRRRTLIGGALAAAAAGPAVIVTRAGKDDTTEGDLAGDHDFLRGVGEAWRVAMYGGVGVPRVRWAGNTPGGPVALVTQRSADTGLDHQGFVETVDGRLTAVFGYLMVQRGTTIPAALLAGPQRDALVVHTAGRSISFSEDYRFDADGRIERGFTPLGHGTVIRRITPPRQQARFGLRSGEGLVPLLNMNAAADTLSEFALPERLARTMAGGGAVWPARLTEAENQQWDVEKMPGYLDRYGYHAFTGPTQWLLRGALPDGRRLVVQTVALDGKARAFCITGRAGETSQVRYLSAPGMRTVNGVVPVLHLRLPDGLGRVVAATDSALSYRVRTGSWLPVAGEAGLIPDAATELEVTPRGGRGLRLPLS